MSAEIANRPTEGNIKQNESGYANIEAHKMSLEQMKKEIPRYWAFVLGEQNSQENINNGRRSYNRPYSAQQAALPSEIRGNPELKEIFDTTAYLRGEVLKHRYSTLSMELSPGLNQPAVPEEIRKRQYAELRKLREIYDAYRERVLASSKPVVSSEQLPPLPRLCIEATKYQIQDKAVPEGHTHSCPICSAKK